MTYVIGTGPNGSDMEPTPSSSPPNTHAMTGISLTSLPPLLQLAPSTSPPLVTPSAVASTSPVPSSTYLPSTTPSSTAQISSDTFLVDGTDGFCPSCGLHHFPQRTPTGLQYPSTCPKQEFQVIPMLFVGTAGVGTGARLGGHLKYGGGRLLEQHRQTAPVLMTGENMTSKVCPLCFSLVRLSKATREVKGTRKLVSVHGSVECTNPSCESFAVGYCRRGRDSNASINIALAGFSQLTSPLRNTLPPYKTFTRPSGATHPEHQLIVTGSATSLDASITGPSALSPMPVSMDLDATRGPV
jgi:hypothetical protein